MNAIHTPECAKRHTGKQVPNDTLHAICQTALSRGMANDFRDAFLWHMDHGGTKVADLCRDSGVSRDVINKLMTRPKSSTSVENAMLIAAYFGKSINQFVARADVTPAERLSNALDLLQPEEQQLLEAQIHGLLARRAR